MKKLLLRISFVLVLFVLVALLNWRVRDRINEIVHDMRYGTQEIYAKQVIDQVYDKLAKATYDELEKDYVAYTKSAEKKYLPLLQGQTYLKLYRDDLYKHIVVDFRLKDFLCKDIFYEDVVLGKTEFLYGLLNKKLLYKTLELHQELEKAGYNPREYELVIAHRHPLYNESIGGAKLSRHIKGEAADITIYDINQDGYVSKEDKDIVLKILDEKVIGNEGGIGLYPGTDNVHFDVRGTRARWNSF